MGYYKLSLLRKTKYGAAWDNIYLEINNGEPKIIAHDPDTRRPLNSKIETISEEDVKELRSALSVDSGC